MNLSLSAIAASGIFAVIVAVVTAALTYVLTKRREHEADWRKVKLDLYRQYVVALSGVVKQTKTPEDQTKYADAINGLTLVAPEPVLTALYKFQDAVSQGSENNSALQTHLDNLLHALRKDIHPLASSQKPELTFRFMSPPEPTSDPTPHSERA